MAHKRDGGGDRLRHPRLRRQCAARHAVNEAAQAEQGRPGAGAERDVAARGHPGREGDGVPGHRQPARGGALAAVSRWVRARGARHGVGDGGARSLPRDSRPLPLCGRCGDGLRAGSGRPAEQRGGTETVRQGRAGAHHREDHRGPLWSPTATGGSSTSKRQTEGKRLRRTLGAFWRWCRDNRHRAPQEQEVLLGAKRRGYDQYDGVRCNRPGLDLVYYAATRAWRYWLNRRGGRKMPWRAFGRRMAADPRPRPKIVQGWGECRGGPRERRATGMSGAGVRTETDDAGCLR
jgi:hypothetical protein